MTQGIEILKAAARLGNKEALSNLNAVAIEVLKEQPKLAFELLTLASELSDPQAKCNLAICFLQGTGTEIDVNEAIRLFKASYKEGYKSALQDLNSLAAKLLSGEDKTVPQDLKKTVELFTFAAQEGCADALNNLSLVGAWFYSGTPPCPKDVTKGIEVLKAAARLGNKQGSMKNTVGNQISVCRIKSKSC